MLPDDESVARPQGDPAAGRRASSGESLPADLAVQREYEVPMDTGQLAKLPTAELLVVHRDWDAELDEHAAEEEVVERSLYGTVASVSGILGLLAALFVGWAVPLSIAAIVFGVLGVRRGAGDESRSWVGIVTGALGTLFSSIWIVYYVNVLGAIG